MAAPTDLRFCWWNVQDFAHFDPARVGQDRWPSSADTYAEKFRRVVLAFDTMFGAGDALDVVGLCEITRPAAEALRQQRFPDHDLVTTDSDNAAFQVVLLIRRGSNLTRRRVWVADKVTDQTRPMGVAQFSTRTNSILLVACHWPALDKPSSQKNRRLCGHRMEDGIYQFLFPRQPASNSRHALVLGDFNAEPHDPLFNDELSASRDREHARGRPHHTDRPKRLVRLYNCGWRLIGEEHPHSTSEPAIRRVGTYYHTESGEWRTFDQVLVTGGLLTTQPPYLDEGALLVRTDVGNLVENKPAKFRYANGVGSGLSDHYPISGRIVLG